MSDWSDVDRADLIAGLYQVEAAGRSSADGFAAWIASMRRQAEHEDDEGNVT